MMGPPSYKRDPYHSHTSRDSYGSGMGVVWEWGSNYWGSLEFPLIFQPVKDDVSHISKLVKQQQTSLEGTSFDMTAAIQRLFWWLLSLVNQAMVVKSVAYKKDWKFIKIEGLGVETPPET